ncbi:hypothetical protein ACJMK2_015287 [Sinanodonta woodiana]|uniref:Transporter n=1 Tax=Sinanodonta woodiana TaxID=1069815 RepID=A0ABD3V4G2_SINWO
MTGEGTARANWGSQIEFILTLIGFAVGLGNVWRFPYLCFRNGGGAFLVPYFLSLFVMGIPLFYMELSFGQFASLGPIKIWIINPAFKGLGIAMVIVSCFIAFYYNVIIAVCIHYFFASMASEVPWSKCNQEWVSCNCRDSTMNNSDPDPWNQTWGKCVNFTFNMNKTTNPSEEYFLNRVLRQSTRLSEAGNINWELALCLLLTWLVVFLVLTKGIESLGKIVYVTSIFPYVLLTALLIRGCTLEGYYDGIKFYLQANMSKLAEADVWSDAAVQIFYSLSVCSGGLIAMASYNNFRNNCLRDAFLVPIINCATSFYAGFVIFSSLGYMAHQKGVGVADVAAGGPGLAFIAYPEALRQMPVAPLWSILFFLMMLMLGFSSSFSIVETVLTGIIDEVSFLGKSKWGCVAFRAAACTFGFLMGLPMTLQSGFHLLDVVDNYVGGFPLLFVGLVETIVIIFIYGFFNFKNDIEMMIGSKLVTKISFWYFGILWCFVTPVCLLAVIVFKVLQYEPYYVTNGAVFDKWADAIGWLIVAAALLPIPAWFFGYYFVMGGYKLCVEVNSTQPKWGPSLEENKDGYRYPKDDHQVPNGFKDFPVSGGVGHSNVGYLPSGDENHTPMDDISTEYVTMEEKKP